MSHPLSAADSDSDMLDSFQLPCVWCKGRKPLVTNAKYCQDCYNKRYRLCSRCKVPYPEAKYFDESGSNRCNSCHRKYLKEREKRELKRKPTASSSSTTVDSKSVRKRECVPISSASSSTTPCSSEDDNDEPKSKTVLLQSLLLEALQKERNLMRKRRKAKKCVNKAKKN